MKKNFVQKGKKLSDGRTYLEYDWYKNGFPGNITLAENVYIDTSYGFSSFHSTLPDAMVVGEGSGIYNRASFIVGRNGKIDIGEYNIVNASVFICNKEISVGNHCMFAWGSLITDSWITRDEFNKESRRKILQAVATDPLREQSTGRNCQPLIIEDNVWVGFDSVILPGVKLGRGCVVGSKTIIIEDVPPYAVVIGNPGRIIRYLNPDDTDAVKNAALQECLIRD